MKKLIPCLLCLIFLFRCSPDKDKVEKNTQPEHLETRSAGNRNRDIHSQAGSSVKFPSGFPDKSDQGNRQGNEVCTRYQTKNHGRKLKTRLFKQSISAETDALSKTGSRQISDSIRLANIQWLRKSGLEIDFSEPWNCRNLSIETRENFFISSIQLSRDRIIRIGFDNDLFDYTDQFYTNGIRIEFVSPALASNPAKYIMLPYWSAGTNYYGLALIQNLYTPSTTKIEDILVGDRPYSAYLLLKSFKITNDEVHHFRQTSEFDLGILGPASLGQEVQTVIHRYIPYNNEPLGWENQIRNDAVINYNFSLEKGIVNREHLQLLLIASGSLGTLYTNTGGGFNLRFGWMNSYFCDLGVQKRKALTEKKLRTFQAYFSVQGSARLVAWDATLEGGFFNRSSIYTIPQSGISNIVALSSLGFTISWHGLGIELEQDIISPEFGYNWWHAWGHIGLLFAF